MAKIVTYEEQVKALKRVGELMKALEKIKPLLEVEAESCRVLVTVTDQSGQTLKAGYKLKADETRTFLGEYYMETARKVRALLGEHHIALDEKEEKLLQFHKPAECRRQ